MNYWTEVLQFGQSTSRKFTLLVSIYAVLEVISVRGYAKEILLERPSISCTPDSEPTGPVPIFHAQDMREY